MNVKGHGGFTWPLTFLNLKKKVAQDVFFFFFFPHLVYLGNEGKERSASASVHSDDRRKMVKKTRVFLLSCSFARLALFGLPL